MKTARATAFGKCILFGEHAVVYGRPAIAMPVTEVTAQAELQLAQEGSGFRISAPDLGQDYLLATAPADDPLAAVVRLTMQQLEQNHWPVARLRVNSTIPLGRGLGSGAAVSTAIARALAKFFGASLSPTQVSALVYEVEKLHHGTPSGIDNTVIAFEQPVYFVKNRPIQRMRVARPFSLVIADTGRIASTREVVGALRQRWQANPERYEGYFDEIAVLVNQARVIIERGIANAPALGKLMNENQELLETLGVSSPELRQLIEAARRAGALGAKLSGAGWGGNMVALVTPQTESIVTQALTLAGATQVIVTEVS